MWPLIDPGSKEKNAIKDIFAIIKEIWIWNVYYYINVKLVLEYDDIAVI